MDEKGSRKGEVPDRGGPGLTDKQEVEKIMNLAAQGDAEAQKRLGLMYSKGEGIAQNDEEAAKWFRKAADQGYAVAQYDLGIVYYYGLGVAQDYVQALKWFRKAAEQGDAASYAYLGYMYRGGDGVPQSVEEAAKWFRKAADQGEVEGQFGLGWTLCDGPESSRDYGQGLKWYRLAAEQGQAIAQNNLGVMYHNGEGVAQNYVEALNWFRKAAEQGEPLAYNNIGNMYKLGEGVAQDYEEALNWYRKAAERDCGLAQFNLGEMYLWGQGVSPDIDEVVKWYRKAAENGEEEPKDAIARIEAMPQGPGSDPRVQQLTRLLLLYPRDRTEKDWDWIVKGEKPTKQNANKFLLACILDYKMGAATIWKNVHRFAEDVLSDPEDLWNVVTGISETEWKSKKQEYNLHQYLIAHMRVWHIGKDVAALYDGDARKIWQGQTPASVNARLMKLGKHGVGANIANMIVGALIDTGQIEGAGDVKGDTHVRWVLGRLLLGRGFKTDVEAIEAARKLYPANPWLLDQPLYFHGQGVCSKSDPACKDCFLRAECAYHKSS
jgi:TPR repeat protein/endonuclease III